MSDPLMTALSAYMDAVEARIARIRDEVRGDLMGELRIALAAEVRGALPEPVAGPQGEPGPQGEQGPAGADGPSADEVRAMVREAVAEQARGWYRGVYQAEQQYQPGQGVTWDGSMWVALRETDARPGTDDSWQLAVKRGRDARK